MGGKQETGRGRMGGIVWGLPNADQHRLTAQYYVRTESLESLTVIYGTSCLHRQTQYVQSQFYQQQHIYVAVSRIDRNEQAHGSVWRSDDDVCFSCISAVLILWDKLKIRIFENRSARCQQIARTGSNPNPTTSTTSSSACRCIVTTKRFLFCGRVGPTFPTQYQQVFHPDRRMSSSTFFWMEDSTTILRLLPSAT